MDARADRRVGGGLEPLAQGADGLLCSEGDLVVVATRTAALPVLRLRGEALSPIPGTLAVDGDEFVAQFELLIDSWAGRTTLVLADGGSEQAVRLDVRPSGSKLGPGEWEELIGELAARSQALPWGMSPGSATGAFEPDALATVHPAIMELELPPLLRLLKALLADPPTRTLRTRAQRPLDLSRSADLRTLRWLSTRPLELAGLRGAAPEGSRPDPRVLVDQPSATASPDHPVTRYVASLLARVRSRLAETVARLRMPAGHGIPDPVARAYARHLADRAEAAMAAIGSVQRAPLFRAVRPGDLSEDVLQYLQDHPVHAEIHRSCRRLLRPGLAYAPGQEVPSALKHSYDLFELMVLYRLVGVVGAALGAGWSLAEAASIARLPHEDRPKDGASWTWRGAGGASVELRYQALFHSAGPPPDVRPFASLSAQGVPDYIIVFLGADGASPWIILDAKYRSSRQSVHDGLADLHRYRDSLRRSGVVADAAYAIVPRLAPGAALYGSPAFIKAHRLGALAIYDGDWAAPISQWLCDKLSAETDP